MIDTLRTPPHAIGAEQSVLGALMIDNNCLDQIADRVIEADFFRHEHRLIFAAITTLAEKNRPFDVITLSEELERSGGLEQAGGMAYIGHIAKDTPTAANARAYAEIVREHAVTRALIRAGTEIADSGFNPDGKTQADLVDEAERKILSIADSRDRRGGGFIPVRKLLARSVERISELHERGDAVSGLSTGYADLDACTTGLHPGELIILAGRPSMGKTTLAINIAEHVALEGRPTAIFSMEMPGEQLATRLISSIGRIDHQRLRTGRLNDDDWPRLSRAVSTLDKTPIHIDETPALSPTDLRARARRLKREAGDIALIVIDYLQLMQAPGHGENRTAEISAISRALKTLAKEMHCPVIALSQLNRNLEQRPNKRPIMSDLRESGSIEQDADIVAFIYRDEVYNRDSPERGLAEIIIGKQRNGPTTTIKMAFFGSHTRFETLARNDHDEAAYG